MYVPWCDANFQCTVFKKVAWTSWMQCAILFGGLPKLSFVSEWVVHNHEHIFGVQMDAHIGCSIVAVDWRHQSLSDGQGLSKYIETHEGEVDFASKIMHVIWSMFIEQMLRDYKKGVFLKNKLNCIFQMLYFHDFFYYHKWFLLMLNVMTNANKIWTKQYMHLCSLFFSMSDKPRTRYM